MAAAASIFFSITFLSIQSPRIEQNEYFYSVTVKIDTNCPSKQASNVILYFMPSPGSLDREMRICSSPFKDEIKCENLAYGIDYSPTGYLSCEGKHISLNPTAGLYQFAKPKYLNSKSTATSIYTSFFLPGFFHRLIVEIASVNRKCSIGFSWKTCPFYQCSFWNLPPAQSFKLTYYSLTITNKLISGNATIVNTELEELNFLCQLNETNQRIVFSWSHLTSSGYRDSILRISMGGNHPQSIISCHPYRSKGNCSTNEYQLEPGTEYRITAKLIKVSPNYNGERVGRCLIRTHLTPIPVNSIEHEVVNETSVRINWSKHPFSVQVRLKNLETQLFESPTKSNVTSALFINLAEGSIYRVEFDISKPNFSPIDQSTNYSIQTNFTKSILENIVRLPNNSFLVNISQYNSSKIKISSCIKPIIGNKSISCLKPNQLKQLSPGTIYNVSINIQRDSFQNRFVWNQTIFKLINTDFSQDNIHYWNNNQTCGVKLVNTSHYSSECFSKRKKISCNALRCGCEYQLKIQFNQTMINSSCSSSPCYSQLKSSNLTIIKIKTPLESVKNLQLVNVSVEARSIEVAFDKLKGCYDQWILICESNSSKEQHIFPNSAVCTNLTLNETYRIYVETNRTGWETVTSNSISTTLADKDKQKKERNIPWFVIPTIIGILVLLGSTAFLRFHRQRHKKQSTEEFTPTKRKISATRLNYTVRDENIFSNSRRSHSTNSKKIVLLSRPIRIQDLVNEYEKLIVNDYYRVSDEYEKLQNSIEEFLPLTRVDQSAKNRYKDIRPYEHTRVKLNPVNEQDSGYINASFITGLHNQQEYIACQGPLKTTINDHWRMIWEQNVTTIVMLTALVERGTTKCEQYWPMEVEQAEMYGEISVCVIECVTLPTYDLRHIQLRKNDEVHSIKHYALKMWADHIVPTDSGELVNIICLIRSKYRPREDGPILAHCSAGVGRTGTFIALDRLLQQFDQLTFDDCLDIYGTVLDMRRCRDKMVQNEAQYLFLYRCLKEEYEKTSGESNYGVIADDPV